MSDWWDEFDPWGELDSSYLATADGWSALARVARRARVIGLDTEFYGLDVRKQSCVGLARVHVWSVAVRTGSVSPLGFARARGWVLPVAALDHPEIRALLEDETIWKCVHNQPVDDHAIHNHGVNLRGCVNTLGLARWMWPGLVTAGGFGLKNLMVMKLRRNPVCEYIDVVNDEREIQVLKTKAVKVTRCSCGAEKCKKRKPAEQHTKMKVVEIVSELVTKIDKYQHPLESIVPDHKRWELLVRYAGEDAVAALEVAELAKATPPPAPFPYTKEARPRFNQHGEDAVVQMEREGFPVDVEFCNKQAAVALADEERELVWLHGWFVVNGAIEYGPHRRAEVDGIWSSPKQLLALFDGLEFPRSPIWKKGRVKPGDAKLDGTALKWLGKNWGAAKQVTEHLLQLKKVRSGKKYLVKLANSGGWIHPICGAAGDSDDRNGAVTGRLGIKGTFEAQQLPTREDVDLYHVRKAVIAQDKRAA